MDEDVRCPNCGTTKYANISLRMMVNVCGHFLCESCVEQLFVKGAAKCPTCNVVLKRAQFRIQLYDDEMVEKDLEIRRRLLKDISLKEEDFDSLKEYNDYLELFETLVHNLANNIDVLETNKKIEQFKLENSAKLTKKRNRISRDLELIEHLLDEEQEIETSRELNSATENNYAIAIKKAAARKENLLDNLLTSDKPAEDILKNHKADMEKEVARINEDEEKRLQQRTEALKAKRSQKLTFSSGIKLGTNIVYDDDEMRESSEGKPYVYVPCKIDNIGPTCPTPRTIQNNGYLKHVRSLNTSELAGGFSVIYPCQRALQEAILDLTFMPHLREAN